MEDAFLSIVQVLGSTVRLSVPLILAGLAGLYSERSGVFDIGLDGKMLVAAFAAGCVAALTGSAWSGLAAGILASMAFALIHGFVCITHRGNQIVSGVAINFLALGLTAILGENWFGQGGRTPTLAGSARFLPIELPFAQTIGQIPVIGPVYQTLISGNNILTYVAFAAVPLTWWVLFRTRFGLRLRAVGENPAAVDTAGISVAFARYRAVLCAGILCGIAGTYLAVGQSAGFLKDMTAGKGYIALAALIFANWRPVGVMWACLLFGFLDALSIRLQGTPVPGIGVMPVQVFQALPYALTVFLLAGFIRRATPPKAGGVPYVKERS
ncbi:simple sugar transport system permease protein [Pseudoxanthobacter soli DSM 19599]|uniref:Simple sugar transport system permease protein n=1 Tax=Pseudoxanthobacter soli DSM 19599 TaxID=1123029 RepID=A0A1M7ZN84_9HYPH|nr:ABC transporter permease [Pseudoxanthobacter soli]SHO66126.1 simple sugar transport system permease protein [Pseudoxanthobacter soli DSM 19599]